MPLNVIKRLLYRLQPSPSILDNTLYFFMHIPKTAGTSMRKLLWEAFEDGDIFPNQQDLIHNDGRYPSLKDLKAEPERLAATRLFVGHYTYGSEAIFPHGNIKSMTFMREPIARCLSLLLHLKNRSPQFKEATFEQILHAGYGGFHNNQLRYFTGAMPKAKSEEKLNRAKDVMDTFDFVGLSEYFNQSLQLLNQQLPITLGPAIHENKAAVPYSDEIETFRPLLMEWHQLDIQLYAYAKKRFLEHCRHFGISEC